MVKARATANQKPRELRRRVVLPARLRSGSSWSDACILNISSRGVMIQTGRLAPQGSIVELRRGDQVFIARVVWRDGARAGLELEDRLPIDDIVTLSHSPSLQLTAAALASDRRKQGRRTHGESRRRGRTFEFVGVAFIAATLAVGMIVMVEQAFVKPLAMIGAVLGGR